MSNYVSIEWLLDYFADDIDYYGKYVREDLLDNMPSIDMIPKDYHDRVCEEISKRHQAELEADRPQGEWKEVYAETDYRNGWIEFSCECCEYQHGLESGEYDWHFGEPIPWKFCPICGARMKGADDE